MDLEKRTGPFIELGKELGLLGASEGHPELERVMQEAMIRNPWFTIENQRRALTALSDMLSEKSLRRWLDRYSLDSDPGISVGVVMAGNIPAVGFHDLLCVLLSGHRIHMKTASDDTVLMRWIAGRLEEFEPGLRDRIRFVDKPGKADAFIGTGSDNSARYFEYYFRGKPSLIRRNRNGVAVLTGQESTEELAALGADIFSYFGLGCRNVAKLFVPHGYDFDVFFKAMLPYAGVIEHNKYANNYDYYKSVFLMNSQPFLTNNFMIIMEDQGYASPLSVLHYEYYDNEKALGDKLRNNQEKIQCVVGHTGIAFGASQDPMPWDYADGCDTIAFLRDIPAGRGG